MFATLCRSFGRPELIDDERFVDSGARRQRRAEVIGDAAGGAARAGRHRRGRGRAARRRPGRRARPARRRRARHAVGGRARPPSSRPTSTAATTSPCPARRGASPAPPTRRPTSSARSAPTTTTCWPSSSSLDDEQIADLYRRGVLRRDEPAVAKPRNRMHLNGATVAWQDGRPDPRRPDHGTEDLRDPRRAGRRHSGEQRVLGRQRRAPDLAAAAAAGRRVQRRGAGEVPRVQGGPARRGRLHGDGGRVRQVPRGRLLEPTRSRARRSPTSARSSWSGPASPACCCGTSCSQAGFTDVRFCEKGGDVGGTWYWNRYPGIACDVESYSYLPLLEEMGYIPTMKFASGFEILEYCQTHGRASSASTTTACSTPPSRRPSGTRRPAAGPSTPTAATPCGPGS